MPTPSRTMMLLLSCLLVSLTPHFSDAFVPLAIVPASNSVIGLPSKQFSPAISQAPFTTTESSTNPFLKNTESPNHKTSTALSMVSTPVAAGALAGALTGGFFAGGLHAIAGPDHLAALLPRCVGQRWSQAGKIGAIWGIGHGFSATLLGVVAYGLKNQIQRAPGAKRWLSSMSVFSEVAVGLSLIIIGAMGNREAREWKNESTDTMMQRSLSSAATPQRYTESVADRQDSNNQKGAILLNGILHGFSWDGAPSLAPALALATWAGNLTFLSAYAAGTVGAMILATTLIGEGTRRAGEWFHRPDIPQKLSFASSGLAIAIGAVWCGLAMKP